VTAGRARFAGACIQDNRARRGVDVLRLGEQHRHVRLLAEYPPDWRGHVARRQRCRGDLIQQRLEQVIVVAIEQRHPNRCACERLRGFEAAEAAADDDHVGHGSSYVLS
jgi:hypothetical protein